MRATIALLFAIFAHASAFAAEPVARLPYRFDYGGWLTIEGTVNGQGPYDFIIDTGSTLTLAFERLNAIHSFAPTGAPPIRVLGISSERELPTYVLGDVGFGGAVLDDKISVILKDWEPPRRTPHGIIGLDFLREYAVFFNYDAKTIDLYPHGQIPEDVTEGLSRIRLEPNDFGAANGVLYTVNGTVNRRVTTFIIDLGSISTLINYTAAEAIVSGSVSCGVGSGLTTGSRLNDIFDDRTRARTALINRIRIGKVTWRKHGVWLYNAPLFDEIGVQKRAYGLAGVDLFGDRNFALDFGENAMYVARRKSRN